MLFVTYPGKANTRFDRKYYVDSHLPLVLGSWQQYGLETVAAFFPQDEGEGLIAICACNFRDEAAIQASFASPEADRIMADIAHFTDAKPVQSLAKTL